MGFSSGRSRRDDPGRVDEAQALVIMALDVVEADRLLDPRLRAKLVAIAPQICIVGDAADVALEVADINRIETDQRGEQPDIRFRQGIAEQEAAGRQPVLGLL